MRVNYKDNSYFHGCIVEISNLIENRIAKEKEGKIAEERISR